MCHFGAGLQSVLYQVKPVAFLQIIHSIVLVQGVRYIMYIQISYDMGKSS